jgi:murein peptide amidase A
LEKGSLIVYKTHKCLSSSLVFFFFAHFLLACSQPSPYLEEDSSDVEFGSETDSVSESPAETNVTEGEDAESSNDEGDATDQAIAAAIANEAEKKTVELDRAKEEIEIKTWCEKLTKATRKFRWRDGVCPLKNLHIGGRSVKNQPLVYADFGEKDASNTTLIFTMVHGDEGTPLYVGLETIRWLVVAPLVNPDGFYRKSKSRVNANGVDLNRNFATSDWHTHAIKSWTHKYGSNPRRFPGWQPNSQPETIFQTKLIADFHVQKIMSVHAPMNFVDYDGPEVLSLSRFPKDYVVTCLKLKRDVNAVSGGFYPGSLGNYAGQELGIPTLTIELPTAKPERAHRYWKQFRSGIKTVIEYKVPSSVASLRR